MNEQERIEKAFSKIKAADSTLEDVYGAIHIRSKNDKMRGVLVMSLLGTILTGTLVFAVARFNMSANFLKQDNKVQTDEIKDSISVIEHNNALNGQENTYINGFFISSPFGHINQTEFGEYMHNGIDLIAEKGTKVLAVSDGIVEDTGFTAKDGNYITLKHSDGYETLYMHLQDILVEKGESVAAGDEIGTVGATGMATGPHLHFELHYNGEAVNPLEFLK
ncbi:MAG: M23 family metallopeptidase [Clostridia bacterium]|nr:M23 family metallopeptidase [Clostridia bacterium]